MHTITRTAFFSVVIAALYVLPVSVAEATPYQKYLNGSCSSNTCDINFPVVPAGKRLEVKSVSCYLRTSSDAWFYSMQLLVLSESGGIANAVTLAPQKFDVPGGIGIWSAAHSIFAFAKGGQRFRAQTVLYAGSVFEQFACHISGDLVAA